LCATILLNIFFIRETFCLEKTVQIFHIFFLYLPARSRNVCEGTVYHGRVSQLTRDSCPAFFSSNVTLRGKWFHYKCNNKMFLLVPNILRANLYLYTIGTVHSVLAAAKMGILFFFFLNAEIMNTVHKNTRMFMKYVHFCEENVLQLYIK
jgi:hypothetical protein